MTGYLDKLVADGVVTVEMVDGKQVVRMTVKSMQLMMTPKPLSGKDAERLEKMVKKYGS